MSTSFGASVSENSQLSLNGVTVVAGQIFFLSHSVASTAAAWVCISKFDLSNCQRPNLYRLHTFGRLVERNCSEHGKICQMADGRLLTSHTSVSLRYDYGCRENGKFDQFFLFSFFFVNVFARLVNIAFSSLSAQQFVPSRQTVSHPECTAIRTNVGKTWKNGCVSEKYVVC